MIDSTTAPDTGGVRPLTPRTPMPALTLGLGEAVRQGLRFRAAAAA